MDLVKPLYRIGFILITASLVCSCGNETTHNISTVSPLSPATPSASEFPSFTISPIPTGSITPQPSFPSTTPEFNEQVYIDPEGWYSVRIPADWQAMDNPNKFSGINGFFETAYLPEMMYIDQDVVICQWIANISTRNIYSMSFTGSIGDSCKLFTLPGVNPAHEVEVIINPSADIPQRVFFLKADPDHFNKIVSTFTWLKPVDENGKLSYQTAPLRIEDISFWDNTIPMLDRITVTEYKLPAEAQDSSPSEEIFYKYLSPELLEVLSKGEKSSTAYIPRKQENINEVISPFGYELRTGAESYLFDLYQDGILKTKNIHRQPDIYLDKSSGNKKLAFIVHTAIDHEKSFYEEGNAACYLVQNDSIRLWENKYPNPMFTQGWMIWSGDDLLILGLGENIDLQVRNPQYDLLYSFSTYFGTHIPVKEYLSWDGHWILGVSSFIIQDGKVLNEILGFEEVYNWYLIDNKPFYFFRKGPRSGISYDGQFLPNYYHEIIHGYCCGLALNNPAIRGNTVRFFGNRDGIWYFVVVEIN